MKKRQVRVKHALTEEQRYDRAKSEERTERNAHLAGSGPVPREENEAGRERGHHPNHQRDRHRPAGGLPTRPDHP